MAGGGTKRGGTIGETDELSYFITKDKVPIHDLQATILHLLSLDPFKLSYKFQGLNHRLIGPTDEPNLRADLLA